MATIRKKRKSASPSGLQPRAKGLFWLRGRVLLALVVVALLGWGM